MAGTVKLTLCLNAALLRRVDRVRGRSGETRNAVVARALRLLTREVDHAKRVRDYVRAYRERPETAREVTAVREVAKRSLSAIPWDDE